jgi:hypothetical protein
MKPFPRRLVVVPVLAVLGALLVAPAAPAAAPDSCTLVVPRHLTVDAPFERFTGRLAGDCAASGVKYASWDLRHSYYRPSDVLIFDEGARSDAWNFYDWDDLGRYYAEPSLAWDATYNTLSQNREISWVRLRSRLSMTTARDGRLVTLRSRATRYRPGTDAFRAWPRRAVTFSYRTCSTCAWQYLATRTTGRYGRVSYGVLSPQARYYRARTAAMYTTWGRTSATSRR